MDWCVCCGAYTGKGSMICVNCQRKLKSEDFPKKTVKEYDKEIDKEKRNPDH